MTSLMANLTYEIQDNVNNVTVTCHDGFTGERDTCSIHLQRESAQHVAVPNS